MHARIAQGLSSARRNGGECHERTQLQTEKKICSTTRILKFFSMRLVNAWNRLPVCVVNAASINVFKPRLDM